MSLDIWVTYPSHCPQCGFQLPSTPASTEMNITHNVNIMWVKCGIYDALYNSNGWTVTVPYIEMLKDGLEKFELHFAEMEKLNPENGWGTAEIALTWLRNWIAICEASIGCIIGVSK